MKRRLRKKTHRGEFIEYGFNIEFTFSQKLTDDEFNDFIYQFIDDAFLSNYECGGGGNPEQVSFWVVKCCGGSLTNDDRAKLEAWGKSRKEISKTVVGPLVDAWN